MVYNWIRVVDNNFVQETSTLLHDIMSAVCHLASNEQNVDGAFVESIPAEWLGNVDIEVHLGLRSFWLTGRCKKSRKTTKCAKVLSSVGCSAAV